MGVRRKERRGGMLERQGGLPERTGVLERPGGLLERKGVLERQGGLLERKRRAGKTGRTAKFPVARASPYFSYFFFIGTMQPHRIQSTPV